VLFFVSRCITVHITINDSYESMHSGSHRAAIMLRTVRVVISNYSKLKNIENTSHDSIHCKMQGALNGKTIHVVYASFVFFFLESSTQLYNHYRTVEENSVKCVPSEGFFGILILPNSIPAGGPRRSPLGELTTFPQTTWSAGEGTPLPIPQPLDAFGVSPTAPHHFENLPPPLKLMRCLMGSQWSCWRVRELQH